MDSKWNFLLVGVGGQGILLASEVLSEVLLRQGFDVKKSEIHGMAQRGGSVVSHVRAGTKVYSALITKGEADYLLSFEIMEAQRYAHYLSKNGIMIVNTQQIDPLLVTIGKTEYPNNIQDRLAKKGYNAIYCDAFSIAKELGNVRAVNIVLLGILASKMDILKDLWIEVIKEKVPAKATELNIKAFERGLTL